MKSKQNSSLKKLRFLRACAIFGAIFFVVASGTFGYLYFAFARVAGEADSAAKAYRASGMPWEEKDLNRGSFAALDPIETMMAVYEESAQGQTDTTTLHRIRPGRFETEKYVDEFVQARPIELARDGTERSATVLPKLSAGEPFERRMSFSSLRMRM